MTDVSDIEHHLNQISLHLATLGDIDAHIMELTDPWPCLPCGAGHSRKELVMQKRCTVYEVDDGHGPYYWEVMQDCQRSPARRDQEDLARRPARHRALGTGQETQ